jgi:hypothetical protein
MMNAIRGEEIGSSREACVDIGFRADRPIHYMICPLSPTLI